MKDVKEDKLTVTIRKYFCKKKHVFWQYYQNLFIDFSK